MFLFWMAFLSKWYELWSRRSRDYHAAFIKLKIKTIWKVRNKIDLPVPCFPWFPMIIFYEYDTLPCYIRHHLSITCANLPLTHIQPSSYSDNVIKTCGSSIVIKLFCGYESTLLHYWTVIFMKLALPCLQSVVLDYFLRAYSSDDITRPSTQSSTQLKHSLNTHTKHFNSYSSRTTLLQLVKSKFQWNFKIPYIL